MCVHLYLLKSKPREGAQTDALEERLQTNLYDARENRYTGEVNRGEHLLYDGIILKFENWTSVRCMEADLNNSTTKNKNKNKTFLALCVHIFDIPKTLSENTASGERCYASLRRKHKTRLSISVNFDWLMRLRKKTLLPYLYAFTEEFMNVTHKVCIDVRVISESQLSPLCSTSWDTVCLCEARGVGTVSFLCAVVTDEEESHLCIKRRSQHSIIVPSSLYSVVLLYFNAQITMQPKLTENKISGFSVLV